MSDETNDIDKWINILNELDKSLESGEISSLPSEQIDKYAIALCQPWAKNRYTQGPELLQISETVRTHILRAHIEKLQNHVVELHNHITTLNDSNKFTQKCIVVLTTASILIGAIQIYYVRESDSRERESLRQHQETLTKQPVQSLNP